MLPSIDPDWPAPGTVRSFATTRAGGVSAAPFDALNLGAHVGDALDRVAENRRRLQVRLAGAEPVWLDQVHGTDVAYLHRTQRDPVAADASWTDVPGVACVVLTADCLPVLLCDRPGTVVAAAHCGWRSLSAGLLTRVLEALPAPGTELLAWLGPGISGPSYEVGAEVRDAFAADWNEAALTRAFSRNARGRYQCDLAALARSQLEAAGVTVTGGQFCTYTDERFYSHRRNAPCGRMATVIWLARE